MKHVPPRETLHSPTTNAAAAEGRGTGEENIQKASGGKKKDKEKIALDIKGIITMSVSLVSFLIAITNSGSLLENPLGFAVPMVIGVISLVIFILVEKKTKSPLVPLKLLFQPAIFTGNIAMLMFGIVQYIIITAIPQLGAPLGSGLGLDPDQVGLLQLPLSLAVLAFGPVFGVMLAKRHKLNTKLLVPSMAIMSVSFLLVTLFHSTSSNVASSLFLFGIGAALLPITLINIIVGYLTPRELTGISSASTSDMRIIGGAIGPVIATVILSSILVPIEVNGTTTEYPSPTAFNIVFIVGLTLSVASTILVMFMRRTAVKALNSTEVRKMNKYARYSR